MRNAGLATVPHNGEMRMKKHRSRRFKRRCRKLHRALLTLCIGVLIFGTAYFVLLVMEYVRDNEVNSRVKEIYYSGYGVALSALEDTDGDPIDPADTPDNDSEVNPDACSPSPTEALAESATIWPEEKALLPGGMEDLPDVLDIPLEGPILQPEFEQLYEANQDIIGWIRVGDCVDYPLVWRDNSYYMTHDFDGNSSNAGSIFLDGRNLPNMSDSAMLIYGHNMKSGAMFGNLDRYRNEDYLRKYPIFTIKSIWEKETRRYVLISLFDASMNRKDSSYIKIVRTSFEDDADKEAFITEMRERSIFKIDLEATADDQLVTLVTCSYSQDNGRFLIVARELRDDETEEKMIDTFNAMEF